MRAFQCDGASFSGNKETPFFSPNATRLGTPGIWFRGKALLRAIQDNLLAEKGLADATDVVVSGCSAGGLATYLHCDQWAELIHSAGAEKKVRCLADSGIFLDHQDPLAMADGPASYENMGYSDGMRWVWENMVVDGSGVDQTCVAATTEAEEAAAARWISR